MSHGRAACAVSVAALLLVCFSRAAAAPLPAQPHEPRCAERRDPDPGRPSQSHVDGARADYLAELLAAADAADLAHSPQWLALLHYEPDLLGSGMTSLARDSRFFLSPAGRHDARAELEATLAAFVDDGRVADGDAVACAFPARYRFLDEHLGFDRSRMPERPRCAELEQWMAGMQPQGLTLVFPEAYMNNPASMFGHTLLRVDPGDEERGRDLLAYAINFAAETGGDGGAAFAFKGISGFYPGTYSVLPYYEKLKQYGDWENRDIWEYRLTFSRAETELVLEHVWELRGVSFAYYFFDDNCSYQLLALLEVARPELRLREDFPLWVIPVDTVRSVAARERLIADVTWRPSPATRLRYRGARLSHDERRIALDLASGRLAPSETQALADRREPVLGVAYDDLRYRYMAHEVGDAESRTRSLELLRELSAAGGGSRDHEADEPVRPRTRPDEGHPSARLSTAVGIRDEDAFVELRLRPAFHELTDPVGGYVAGSQIVILEPALRWLPERERLRLEELVVVDVTSISARDAFIRPISWKIATALRTRLVPDSGGELDPELVWRTDGGAGLAWEPFHGLLAFGFAEAAADVGEGLSDNYALAPGASLGVLTGDSADRTRLLVAARALRFVVGDTTTSYRAGATLRVTTSARTAVELEAAWEHAYGEDWLDTRLTFKWFFRRH